MKAILFILTTCLFIQCYTAKWATDTNTVRPPDSIADIFKLQDNNTLIIEAKCPGYTYKYDVGEKASKYGLNNGALRYNQVKIKLNESMPEGTVLANFTFTDKLGNKVHIHDVDLLRLIPNIDSKSEMMYPEVLLEEFNRFGYVFRKEHNEFSVESVTSDAKKSLENAYRCNITNNCLDPGKWEFSITNEDYRDFTRRLNNDDINLNQNRMLAHSWFQLDESLYTALFQLKNDIAPNLELNYNDLSNYAETVLINFEKLRSPIKYEVNTNLLEIGHQSHRPIKPLDSEEFYKYEAGLILNNQSYTYSSILDTTISLTQFKDEGFYTAATPKVFDFGWMRHTDDVKIEVLDVEGTEAYVQITLSGQWTPYNITIGNVDLAQLDEQKLFGMLFGINTYPKSRRYNPKQNTIQFDADFLPEHIKPYVLLTDKKTGNWVNNQYKGVEKVYLTYENLERDILNIYVLSYERITPVWMASVKIPKKLREKVRTRKNLYAY